MRCFYDGIEQLKGIESGKFSVWPLGDMNPIYSPFRVHLPRDRRGRFSNFWIDVGAPRSIIHIPILPRVSVSTGRLYTVG
jgi:hypothetical protein